MQVGGWSLLGGSRGFGDKLSKYVIDCDDSTRLDSSLFCIVGPLQSISRAHFSSMAEIEY